MHDPNSDEAPFNPISIWVWLLVLPAVAIELALQLGEAGIIGGARAGAWRANLITSYGLFDGMQTLMLQRMEAPLDWLMRYVTYPFFHLGLGHVAVAAAITLGIAKFISETLGDFAAIALFFGGAIAGAFGYSLIFAYEGAFFGMYPAAFGLIGGFARVCLDVYPEGRTRWAGFSIAGMLIGIQLLWALLFGTPHEWVAELVAFIAGFGLSYAFPVTGQDGFRAALSRMRRR